MSRIDTSAPRNGFSRRDSLRYLGVAGLGALFGSPSGARAQETPAANTTGLQGAGFYRLALGQASVVLLSDGSFPMDTSQIFHEVPESEMASAKKDAFVSTPTVTGHVNALLVREGTNVILIDTGCGNLFGPGTGFLGRSLSRAGVTPDQVTHVVLTHAHPDHIGGLVSTEDKLTFPNAKVLINRAEHEFWTASQPSFAKSALPQEMITMMVSGAQKILGLAKPKLELVKPGDRVGSAVTLVDAPGHTPGHLALSIESGGESLLYVTDAVHVPSLQLSNLDWHGIYDTDPVGAVATRRMLLETAAKDRKIIAGAHIPFPSFGHLVPQDAGYRFVPAIWEW